MHSIFSDYSNKISPTGRDGVVACQSDFFEDTYKDAMEYEEVKLTKNDEINSSLYDSWFYSNSSYKKLISEKTIIFPPSMEINEAIVFSGQYVRPQRQGGTWLITSDDKQYLNKMKGIITECTETFRWYDECGVLQEYPAVVQASSETPSLDEDKYMVLTVGKIKGKLPLDENTAKLEEGSEFIIGNTLKKAKYKLSFEDDFESDNLLVFGLERYQINPEVDNVELQIANYANRPIFNLSITPLTAQIVPLSSVQLEYALLDRNNQESDFEIVWTSSDENVATVDEMGVLSSLTLGSTTIRAEMKCNPDVYDEITIDVVAVPIDSYELYSVNGDTEIYRSDTQTFEWQLLNNGVIESSNFTFAIDVSSTSNTDDYVFTVIDGNNYSIECLKEGGTVVINVLEDGGLNTQVTYDLIGYW